MFEIYEEYVHLLRLALEGRQDDIIAIAKRNLRKLTQVNPQYAENVKQILSQYNTIGKFAIRDVKQQQPLPIDIDSKLELIRREYIEIEDDIVWPESVQKELYSVIEERNQIEKLAKYGLGPTRTILFVGPPGVGKTLAAKWLSSKLLRPLLTLDLAAVMSSYLGKTGNNIRAVLNYAQKSPSILLLDEFDAIAKKRNDDSEVGELKRLVTVLLQTIDDWPSSGVLIAATNHPEILDPAVWRRFERVVRFPTPSSNELLFTIRTILKGLYNEGNNLLEALSVTLEGNSFAEVVRQINNVLRESVIQNKSIELSLEELLESQCKKLDKDRKMQVAQILLSTGFSQRRVSEFTGFSRDTLRKHINK